MRVRREVAGSSPHTWGTQSAVLLQAETQRFIPTHVGNTNSLVSARMAATVHPHTRGEHTITLTAGTGVTGSSPHTWGTRGDLALDRVISRFIPTHVGNT